MTLLDQLESLEVDCNERLEKDPSNVVLQARLALIHNLEMPLLYWRDYPPLTDEEAFDCSTDILALRARIESLIEDPMYSEIEKFNN